MARSRVSFLVGTAALVLAVLALPRRLEAQSSGVLQATVRVVDYGSSLAALRAAQSTWAQAARPQDKVAVKSPAPAEYSKAELTSEPMVITINYLR